MYKDILVCVNEARGRENTIKAAAQFANENNATLTGLYVRVTDTPVVAPYGMISDAIAKEAIKREERRTAKARELFESITQVSACKGNWVEVFESQHPLKAAAYCDLVVASQVDYDPQQGRSNRSFVNSLILETGKPVVLIPKDWEKSDFGSNIVIGWDESREASRAIHDAMPLLQKADHVDTVSVDYKGDNETADVSEISSYLTQRNVSNTFSLKQTDDELDTPEKVIQNVADQSAADLIVVGGYGHSRLREIFLGGATRYLTKHSHVPVLFSH